MFSPYYCLVASPHSGVKVSCCLMNSFLSPAGPPAVSIVALQRWGNYPKWSPAHSPSPNSDLSWLHPSSSHWVDWSKELQGCLQEGCVQEPVQQRSRAPHRACLSDEKSVKNSCLLKLGAGSSRTGPVGKRHWFRAWVFHGRLSFLRRVIVAR